MSHSNATAEEILQFLKIILIEIRATDNIKKANILADVAHNVPNMILAGRTPAEIQEKIIQRAVENRCKKTISDYMVAAGKAERNRFSE